MIESNLFDIILEALINRVENGYPLSGMLYEDIARDLQDCVDILEDVPLEQIIDILSLIDGGNYIENRA